MVFEINSFIFYEFNFLQWIFEQNITEIKGIWLSRTPDTKVKNEKRSVLVTQKLSIGWTYGQFWKGLSSNSLYNFVNHSVTKKTIQRTNESNWTEHPIWRPILRKVLSEKQTFQNDWIFVDSWNFFLNYVVAQFCSSSLKSKPNKNFWKNW